MRRCADSSPTRPALIHHARHQRFPARAAAHRAVCKRVHEALRSASFRRRSDRGDRCAWLAERDAGFTPSRSFAFGPMARGRCSSRGGGAERSTAPGQRCSSCASFTRGAGASRSQPPPRTTSRPSARVPTTLALAASIVLAVAWWRSSTSTVDAPMGKATRRPATALNGCRWTTVRSWSSTRPRDPGAIQFLGTPGETLSGRGLLTVAKDAARPFSVEAGLVAVRAVGPRSTCASGARHRGVVTWARSRSRHRNFSRAGGVACDARAAGSAETSLPRARVSLRDERLVLPAVRPTIASRRSSRRWLRSSRPTPSAQRSPGRDRGSCSWTRRWATRSRSFNRRNHVQITLADPGLVSCRSVAAFARKTLMRLCGFSRRATTSPSSVRTPRGSFCARRNDARVRRRRSPFSRVARLN